jgi:Family of unknown function (DUF6526)
MQRDWGLGGSRCLRLATSGRKEEQVDAGESHATFVHYLIISQQASLSSMMEWFQKEVFRMANAATQSFANHTRLDPPFHFFLLPLGLVAVVLSVIRIIHYPNIASTLGVILAVGFVMIAFKARGYALKAQDRVIRLEERLRLAMLMPEAGRPRIGELTESQLIALRFASDAELPGLAMRALNEGLTSKQIKSSIQSWRGDYFRV